MLQRVLANRRTFAVAVFGNYQQIALAVGNFHAKHVRVVFKANTLHAACVAARGAHVFLTKHNGFACACAQNNAVSFAHTTHVYQLVAVFKVNGDKPIATTFVILGNGCFLYHTLLCSKHQILVVWEIAGGDNGGWVLVLGKWQHVYQRTSARRARTNGQLVHLKAVHLTFVGKEQHVIVGGCHKQVFYKVVVFKRKALHTLAAALLRAVGGNRQALNVT